MTLLFKATATPNELINIVGIDCPEVWDVLERVKGNIPYIKRQIMPEQAAVVYYLAQQYDKDTKTILDIGTAWGYSAATMAEAAPTARIVTLNPKQAEYEHAVQHLLPYSNVIPLMKRSWDFLDETTALWDMVLVDGDHGQVERDLPWWDRLNAGGLILFHDYSAEGSWRPNPEVVEVIDIWAKRLNLRPGVLFYDDRGAGMIGFYKP